MESLDEMLLSNWVKLHSSVPSSYVQPPETRPGDGGAVLIPSGNNTIPVIDLGGGHDRDRDHETIKQILKASEEFGFFQVINHGVSKDLMEQVLKVFKEFHAMPSKEKLNECSKDPNRSCKLYTSSENHGRDAVRYWKDTLIHPCLPSGQYMEFWPQKPSNYREVVGNYTRELRKLGLRILELLCEGLGLSPKYFNGELSENPFVVVHHYPPCPEPSLTLGLAKHRDPSVLTILLQEMHGLQVLKDGQWFGVEPIPHAFVVNIGLLLQVISNGRLIGAEHRVVTNSSTSRTSVAYFINPLKETVIEPAMESVNSGMSTKPLYRSMTYAEFRESFFVKGPKIESELHN